MSTTRHTADITDPVTGEHTTLAAATEADLEQLITQHLEATYPEPSPPGTGEPAVVAAESRKHDVTDHAQAATS